MRALAVILMVLQGSASLGLILRGLAGRFPILISYLGGSLLRGLLLASYDRSTPIYRDLWINTLPLVTLLQVGTAVEAYQMSLEELPGARRVIHWVILGLAAGAAILVQLPQRTYTAYGILSQAHQAVGLALGVAAILMAALLTYLRPTRRRNAIVHERLLALHFTGMSLLLAFLHLGALGWTSTGNELLSIVCCLGWLVWLRADGESLPSAPEAPPCSGGFSELREKLLGVLRGSR